MDAQGSEQQPMWHIVLKLWPKNLHISLEQNLTIRFHDGGKKGHLCNGLSAKYSKLEDAAR